MPRQFLPDLTTATTIDAVRALDTTANNFLSATFANPFLGLLNGTGSPFNTATTISRAQLLQAFPQFTSNLFVQEYNGSNSYNSLQLQGSKRFAKDLTLNLTYTWSQSARAGELSEPVRTRNSKIASARTTGRIATRLPPSTSCRLDATACSAAT